MALDHPIGIADGHGVLFWLDRDQTHRVLSYRMWCWFSHGQPHSTLYLEKTVEVLGYLQM